MVLPPPPSTPPYPPRTSIKSIQSLLALIVAPVVFLAVGCSGGGGGGASSISGTWFGAMEDGFGDLWELTIVVETDGSISDIQWDGESTGATGSISEVSNNVFKGSLSDGTVLSVFTSVSGEHAWFIDSEANCGILQRDALGLPAAYATSDLTSEDFSGKGIAVNSAFNHLSGDDLEIQVSISIDGSFSGGAVDTSGLSDTFTSTSGGALSLQSSSYGVWTAQSEYSTGESFDWWLFLSPDKSTVGAYASASDDPVPIWPQDYSFLILSND